MKKNNTTGNYEKLPSELPPILGKKIFHIRPKVRPEFIMPELKPIQKEIKENNEVKNNNKNQQQQNKSFEKTSINLNDKKIINNNAEGLYKKNESYVAKYSTLRQGYGKKYYVAKDKNKMNINNAGMNGQSEGIQHSF